MQLLGLYMAVLIQRTQLLTSLEIFMSIWALGYMLDEVLLFTIPNNMNRLLDFLMQEARFFYWTYGTYLMLILSLAPCNVLDGNLNALRRLSGTKALWIPCWWSISRDCRYRIRPSRSECYFLVPKTIRCSGFVPLFPSTSDDNKITHDTFLKW